MFDKEFKQALSYLPAKEKDKLVLRLLRKDHALANRLYFELLDTKTVDDRREEMEERVISRVTDITDGFYSPGYLMMDLRYLSGDISEHVKTTKDKYGEASLNLLMLTETLTSIGDKLTPFSYGRNYKLGIYIIARAFKILILIKKLHEDYFMEFQEDLKILGMGIGNIDVLMRIAIQNGLDVNWLILGDIPEDIVGIHKDLRSQGYLK